MKRRVAMLLLAVSLPLAGGVGCAWFEDKDETAYGSQTIWDQERDWQYERSTGMK